MKLIFTYFLLLALITVNKLYSQCSNNLIRNASFEEKGFLVSDNRPDDHSQGDKLSHWEDDHHTEYDQFLDPITFYHSPDWYDNSDDAYFNIYEDVPPCTTGASCSEIVPPHSGNRFIGMAKGELIQQKLENKLEKDESYILTFYIRQFVSMLTDHLQLAGSYSLYSPDEIKLNAYIDNAKIEYEDKNSWETDKKLPNFEILSMNLYPQTDGFNYWRKMEVSFTVPDDDYDWIGIEISKTIPENSLGAYYILFDDVSLVKGCIVECSRTDGCMMPYVRSLLCGEETQHTKIAKTNILAISNLDNAKNVTMVVRNGPNPNNQIVFVKTITCANGINGNIYWDGRNNNNADLAEGIYYLTLTRENSCGTDVFDWDTDGFNSEITIINPYSYPPDYCNMDFLDFICNEYNLITPQPCCKEQPDIYVKDLIIGNPQDLGNLQYIAVNNIYIGPNVIIENDASVLFQAGNEIIGDPFQDVEIGADVIAEIVPCPSQRLANPYSNSEDEIAINNLFPEIPEATFKPVTNVFLSQNQNIQFIPNPSASGIFTVSIISSSHPGYATSVFVYNVLGEVVFQQVNAEYRTPLTIDISTQPKGIYFVKFSIGSEMSVQKIVYQ